jgi:hypothetical protein
MVGRAKYGDDRGKGRVAVEHLRDYGPIDKPLVLEDGTLSAAVRSSYRVGLPGSRGAGWWKDVLAHRADYRARSGRGLDDGSHHGLIQPSVISLGGKSCE